MYATYEIWMLCAFGATSRSASNIEEMKMTERKMNSMISITCGGNTPNTCTRHTASRTDQQKKEERKNNENMEKKMKKKTSHRNNVMICVCLRFSFTVLAHHNFLLPQNWLSTSETVNFIERDHTKAVVAFRSKLLLFSWAFLPLLCANAYNFWFKFTRRVCQECGNVAIANKKAAADDDFVVISKCGKCFVVCRAASHELLEFYWILIDSWCVCVWVRLSSKRQ